MRRSSIFSSRVLLLLAAPLVLVGGLDRLVGERSEPAAQTDPTLEAFRNQRPEIVLVGNSITRTAFSEGIIGAYLQAAGLPQTLFKYDLHGSGPAVWYLVIKNAILKAERKPEMIVLAARPDILFNNAYGTTPKYRKRYFTVYAGANEPVLEEKLYDKDGYAWTMDGVLSSLSRVYRNRDIYQEKTRAFLLNAFLRAGESLWAGSEGQERLSRIEQIRAAFRADRGIAGLLRVAYRAGPREAGRADEPAPELSDDATLMAGTRAIRDSSEIGRTFLPDICELCERNGVKLVLVCHRSRSDGSPRSARHKNDLWLAAKEFLAAHHPTFETIDMAHCAGITSAHFYAGDHFTRDAQKILSEYFAAQLVRIVTPTPGDQGSDELRRPSFVARSLLDRTYWAPPKSGGLRVEWRDGALHGESNQAAGEREYLTHEGRSLGSPPILDVFRVEPDRYYLLEIKGALDADVSIIVFVLQYDRAHQIRSDKWRFWGHMLSSIRTHPEAEKIRVAIRIAGTGSFRFDEITLHAARIEPR